jgi:hypothetical protein
MFAFLDHFIDTSLGQYKDSVKEFYEKLFVPKDYNVIDLKEEENE